MSRVARRDNSNDTSLFPFLAVLLCTMGALVTLLVITASVSRRIAERQETEEAKAVATPVLVDADAERRRVEFEQLKLASAAIAQRRAAIQSQLDTAQQQLMVVEESLSRTHKKYESLRKIARELEQLDGEQTDDREQAMAELERRHQLADQYREEIANAELAAIKPKSFAIIPYEGGGGTHRRPVYIECVREKIILQPDGIELGPDDFHPELGAGTPLVAAIRAAQQYYDKETPDPADRPYPLIIVRPDGIYSYLFASNALKTWDADFGYELVEADWNLDYGPANPELTVRKNRAVTLARVRRDAIAESAPGIYARYAVSSFEFPVESKVRDGDVGVSGTGSLSGGDDSGGLLLPGGGELGGLAGGVGKSPLADPRSGSSQPTLETNGGLSGGSAGTNLGLASAGNPRSGTGQTGNQQGSGQFNTSQSATAGTGIPGSGGQQSGEPSTGSPSSGNPYQFAQGSNSASADGSPSSGAMAASSSGAAASQTSTSGGGGQPGAGGQPSAGGGATANISMTQSGSRGSGRGGGGGRGEASSGFEVVRPIRIVATSTQLVILSDQTGSRRSAAGQSAVVSVSPDMRVTLQQLNVKIREHVAAWGMAGSGLRWKPQLELTVEAGGEQIAAVVTKVARNSGIDVVTPRSAQQPTGGSRATQPR